MNHYKKSIVYLLIIGVVTTNTIAPLSTFASTSNKQDIQSRQKKEGITSLNSNKLQYTMEGAEASILLMELYNQMILKQPNVNLDSIQAIDNNLKTNIIEHQRQAQNNAKQWDNDVRPQITKMTEAIMAYNIVFENKYSQLLEAVNQKNVTKLRDDIQQLYQGIEKNIQENDNLIEKLILLRDKMNIDIASFKMDSNTLTTVLTRVDASIPYLQKNIETQMTVINENNKLLIAGHALLVIPFFVFTIAGGAMIGTAASEILNAENTIKLNNAEINNTKKEAASLTVLRVYNDSVLETMSQAVSRLQNISDGWRSIGAKYKNLLELIKHTDVEDIDFAKYNLETDKKILNQLKEYVERHVQTCGWVKSGGKQYYLSRYDGKMKTGFQTIENQKYYFGNGADNTNLKEGEMATGFQTIDGKIHYFGRKDDESGLTEGQMARWLTKIDGKLHYFSGDGSTWATNSWLADYNQEGQPNTWYILEKGETASGWKQIDGTWCYFDPNNHNRWDINQKHV